MKSLLLSVLNTVLLFPNPSQADTNHFGAGGVFKQILAIARLAGWREDANSQVKKVVNHSGKNITWHGFCHAYISMHLNAGVPLPTVAANTDRSIKYIQEH